MAQIVAYLNFNGNCREAMTFYHGCLGGELTLQSIAESPMAAQMPSEMGGQILHSHLRNGALELMGSDMLGKALAPGNNVAICVNCESDTEINSIFEKLATGAQAQLAPHQTFWGAFYAEITDQFGLRWMLNYAKM